MELYNTIINGAKEIDIGGSNPMTGALSGWTDDSYKQLYGHVRITQLEVSFIPRILKAWFSTYYNHNIGNIDLSSLMMSTLSLITVSSVSKGQTSQTPNIQEMISIAENLGKVESQLRKNSPLIDHDSEKEDILAGDHEEQHSIDSSDVMYLSMISDPDYQDTLINIASFQALVMLRHITKTNTSVDKYQRESLTRTLKSLCPNTLLTADIPPPSAQFVTYFKLNCMKGNDVATSLLAYVMNLYMEARQSGATPLVDYLNAGCLTHLKGNGLALLELIFQVHLCTKLKLSDLFDMTYSSQCAQSIDRAYHHFKEYAELKSNDGKIIRPAQVTWWWARLFNDKYFMDMSIRNNYQYCLRLACILTCYQQQGSPLEAAGFGTVSAKELSKHNDFATKFVAHLTPDEDKFMGGALKILNTAVPGPSGTSRPPLDIESE
ncbi:N [Gammahymrhavirus longicaudata]|uniref:Nucleoprotein n=1 Tax=Diachasmimorpha longicaudata rhabdovirus TaxID=1585246 RepID=A0A0X9JZ07_9RHAB|nr:N [Diachasmimorpha longicaudata rhabdovirus] [Diachasmimorpha longicaudata rhabdovirus]ALU09124.1 N [Diachasmimorpha longicaudata rhabdovirus] [Diachasmimorpha longicaudata rhabdovirus]